MFTFLSPLGIFWRQFELLSQFLFCLHLQVTSLGVLGRTQDLINVKVLVRFILEVVLTDVLRLEQVVELEHRIDNFLMILDNDRI